MSSLKFALRSLLKTPIVTAVAALSVALGIGANVAIFSVFDQILLQHLPVAEPERLVNLVSPGPRSGLVSCGDEGPCDAIFSYPMFRDLERVQQVFTGIAAHREFGANLASNGVSEGGAGTLVSGSYFPVLGLRPHLGRLLGPEDDRERGGGQVVVLSYEYWRRRFGAAPNVLDKTLIVNGQPLTIIGVAPAGFHGTTFGSRPLVYAPISLREVLLSRWRGLDDRRAYFAYLFARLKPGITREEARTSFNAQYRSILTAVDVPLQIGMSPSMTEQFRRMEMQLEPGARGQSRMPGAARQPLILLMSVTMIVLLICCANVANLLLGRAAARSTEMAVRLSIGAGRKHIVTQLLVESILLGVTGGVAGLLVARWTMTAMTAALSPGTAENLAFHLDGRMLAFAAALSLTTGVLFGLFPAIYSTRPNLVGVLKSNAAQPAGARTAARFRVTLATAQIALSMALLVSAGLLAKSLLNVSRANLGINTERLVVFGVAPATSGYSVVRTRQILDAIETALSNFPGVTDVTATRQRLLSGDLSVSRFQLQGVTYAPDDDDGANLNFVGTNYLRTLGINLVAGREFSPADSEGTPKVAMVNEAFLQRGRLGRDVIGKRLQRLRRSQGFDIEIVGIAANSAYDEVKQRPAPLVLMPLRQDPDLAGAQFYVRTRAAEQELLAAIPQLVRDVDPTLPVAGLRTMTDQIHQNVSIDRFVTSASAAFATLATLLAALGLYGVLTYTVAQRTREFGLRMALGAEARTVRRLVLRQVGLMTAVGAVIGLAAALVMGRAAESLLFQMNARDPYVFGAAFIVLGTVALVAGFVPAQRAARVDPMTALRYE